GAFGAPFGAPPESGRGVIREPLPPSGGTPNAGRQPVPPSGGAPNGAPNASRQSPPSGGTQNASARRLKTAIPEQWIKPWEFQISREEALYDMGAAASSRSSPLAFIRDLTSRFGHRQAWLKWQALLAGKSLDEQ